MPGVDNIQDETRHLSDGEQCTPTNNIDKESLQDIVRTVYHEGYKWGDDFESLPSHVCG